MPTTTKPGIKPGTKRAAVGKMNNKSGVQSKRDDVMSYMHLIASVAVDVGLSRQKVKEVLEASQRHTANFLRKEPGNRVHYGRFGIIYSRMTTERKVNNPRAAGEQLTSPAHLVIRLQEGTRTKQFLADTSLEWDDVPASTPEGTDDPTESPDDTDEE